jgi:TetR/AcrR family transcriptional regulator, cholesterol catabolism regulator
MSLIQSTDWDSVFVVQGAGSKMISTKPKGEAQSSVKRSWILDKAGALFWQKGYYSTSMRDIATACRCKPANIYNYFESKEDILFEVISDITERAVLAVRDLKEDETTPPVEQLKSFVKGHFGLLAGIKRSNVLISDTGLKDLSTEHRKAIVALRDEYDLILRRIIKRGVDSGDFAVKDEKVVNYMISSVIVRSSIWFSNRGRLSADEVGDLMFDFVYRGVKSAP